MANKNMDYSKYKKILVRSTNWLGDAVMTTPFFKLLRELFPDSEISVLALPYIAPVFENNPNIDKILILERKKGISGVFSSLKPLFTKAAARYDLGISLPNSIGAALDLKGAGCREILGYNRELRGFLLDHKAPVTKEIFCFHESFYYMNILRYFFGASNKNGAPSNENSMDNSSLSSKTACGIIDKYFSDISSGLGLAYELYITEAEKNEAIQNLTNQGIDFDENIVIGINPGAFFGSAKRWFTDRYAETVKTLSAENKNLKFVIFGSAKEIPIGEEIKKASGASVINSCGRTSIRQLMAQIAVCDLFVTNDSGAMHIAGANNIPIIAIFGSTDHISTYPICRNYKIIRHAVECSPCKKRECPQKHHNCMKLVSVTEVVKAIDSQLDLIKK
ncbi:MAG: lipopolysaccharide heptosyltransferase II [Candidatus Wallbacteria bacterium]